jgi:hypothetical protein
MKAELESSRLWTKLIGSAAFGATAMYVFDPVRGRRRRAIARDKVRSFVCDARDTVSSAARDVRYRAQGLQAEARRQARQETVVDDLRLIERVRSKMGRVVSHPHAIQVGAEHGRVSLSGPILTHEVTALLRTVHSVPGVIDVEEHLVAHDNADSVPSLQGVSRRSDWQRRHDGVRWTPAGRAAAMLGGGVLALCALRQRGIAAATLAAIGVGVGACAATADRRTHRSGRGLRTTSPAQASGKT